MGRFGWGSHDGWAGLGRGGGSGNALGPAGGEAVAGSLTGLVKLDLLQLQ